MNCEYCQSPVHIWFQCPKKPDGWKPARLARVRIGTDGLTAKETPKSDVSASPPSDVRVHTQSPARLAKKSTALRIDAATVSQGGRATAGSPKGKEARKQVKALPVDTNSEPLQLGDADPLRSGSATLKDAEVAAPKPTKFDKKAWQRSYMRTYIRQYREDVKSGKRTPKPREQGKDAK